MANKTKKKVKSGSIVKSERIETLSTPSAFSQYFPFIISGVFLLLSFAGILNHEMWRDEYQAWMVARDAHSLPQLFQNLRYEGNPALWHLFLFLITSVSHNAFWMQLFHILIATSFVFLFNRYSPFTLLQKFLFTFGYYSFFEFNIISRSYGLGLLLVLLFCVLYKNRYKYLLLISIVLFLLANTHVYGFMISLCFAGILFLDYVLNRRSVDAKKVPLIKLTGCIIIIGAGWILSGLQIYPKPDSTFPVYYPTDTEDLMIRFQYAFFRLVTAYYPLPRLDNLHFWNTNVLEPVSVNQAGDFADGSRMNPIWPLLIFIIFLFGFIRKPLILFLYTLGTGCLIYFFYYTELIHSRYCGHLFLLLLACMWIAPYYKDRELKNKFLLRLSTLARKGSVILFYAMLVVGFIGGVGSYYKDLVLPFSGSKEAALFLKENKLENLEIIGSTDFNISPLPGILDRTIFYPQTNKEGSFIIWNKGRLGKISLPDVFAQMEEKAKRGIKKMLFITEVQPAFIDSSGNTQYLTEGMITNDLHILLLKEVKSGIVADEKYFVNLVEERK